MKLLRILGIFLFLVFFSVALVGIFLPSDYDGRIEGTISAPPAEVWKALTDIDAMPKRRPEIVSVDHHPANDKGLPVWQENMSDGFAIFETLESRPSEFLKLSLKESSFGMNGSWSYTLKAVPEGTHLTIEEHSEITSFPVRLVMTLVGRDTTLKKDLYLLRQAFSTKEGSAPTR